MYQRGRNTMELWKVSVVSFTGTMVQSEPALSGTLWSVAVIYVKAACTCLGLGLVRRSVFLVLRGSTMTVCAAVYGAVRLSLCPDVEVGNVLTGGLLLQLNCNTARDIVAWRFLWQHTFKKIRSNLCFWLACGLMELVLFDPSDGVSLVVLT